MSWHATLERADLLLRPLGRDLLVLELPDGSLRTLRLVRIRSGLDHARAGSLLAAQPPASGPAGTALLVAAPHASAAAAELLTAAGASLVTDDGMVALAGAPAAPASSAVDDDVLWSGSGGRGPLPWALRTVARRLMFLHPARQAELARVCNVTQKTVSTALSRLRAHGLATAGPAGAEPVDLERLVSWWLSSYPAGEEIVAHYAAADPLAEQLSRAAAVLGAQRFALSGSAAADELAPWARPTRAVLYCVEGRDLTAAGLVPAPAEAATLSLVVSSDPGLWMPRRPDGVPWATTGAGLELADPLQVLLDLQRDPGPDADQALRVLRAELLRGGGEQHVREHLRACAGAASP